MDTENEALALARLTKRHCDQQYRIAANARRAATRLVALLEDTTRQTPTPMEDTNHGKEDRP